MSRLTSNRTTTLLQTKITIQVKNKRNKPYPRISTNSSGRCEKDVKHWKAKRHNHGNRQWVDNFSRQSLDDFNKLNCLATKGWQCKVAENDWMTSTDHVKVPKKILRPNLPGSHSKNDWGDKTTNISNYDSFWRKCDLCSRLFCSTANYCLLLVIKRKNHANSTHLK